MFVSAPLNVEGDWLHAPRALCSSERGKINIHVSRVGQNHIYMQAIFGRETTKCKVICSVYMRFWPTLHVSAMWCAIRNDAKASCFMCYAQEVKHTCECYVLCNTEGHKRYHDKQLEWSKKGDALSREDPNSGRASVCNTYLWFFVKIDITHVSSSIFFVNNRRHHMM
jgi:hypothetical protein